MKSLTASTLIAPKYLLCIFAILLACAIAGCALYGAWLGAFLLAEAAFHSLTLFGGGEVEVDAEIIRYSTNLRSREMKWSEITKVEATSSAIVFRSHNKRLRLPIKGFEESEEFAPTKEYIQQQIQAWDIPQQVPVWDISQHQMQSAARQMPESAGKTRPTIKRPQPPLSM